MPATWAAIDALVQDIGELSADVHLAERTLSTDPRTQAARRALDKATDAVCAAIDETSEAAVGRAAAALRTLGHGALADPQGEDGKALLTLATAIFVNRHGVIWLRS